MLLELCVAMVTSNAFGIEKMSDLPEVQRLRLVRSHLSAFAEEVQVALLMLDCAMRNAEFSAQLIRAVAALSPSLPGLVVVRVALALSTGFAAGKYWGKLSRNALVKGLKQWTAEELLRAAACWKEGGVNETIEACKSLPFVGSYLGHAMAQVSCSDRQ